MPFLSSRRVAEMVARVEGLGPVRQIAFLGEGEFTAAWLINEAFVCRFAKHDAAAASLQRECCLLPALAPLLPVAIPQPRCHVVSMPPFLLVGVHQLLEGEPLGDQRFAGLSRRRQAGCAQSIAGFLAALHDSDLCRARACGVQTRDYRARFSAAAMGFEQHLAARLDVAERTYIRSTFERFLDDEVEQLLSNALLHADLSPSHVLWDVRRARVCGIIDFGDMVIGHAAEDLAGLYDDFGPAFVRTVLRNLPDRDRETLARRVYRLYELFAIEWAVGHIETAAAVLPHIARQRRNAPREPWRRLL